MDVVAVKDQQVRDNIMFTLWESELEPVDIIEWVYAKDQEYINSALTLALIRRIELIPKEPKISKPIWNLFEEYDNIVFKKSHDIRRILIITHKINLVHPFPIIVRQKTFDLII